MCSPVFEKMFTSEFQEKDNNEVPLPGKKSSEIQELLLMIYPSVADKEEKQVTEENCYFLVKLAHEYQIEAIVQRCEDFIVNKVKTKPRDDVLAELMFAQTYKLEKLKRASIDKAYNLSLTELKRNKVYDQIPSEDLKEIMEGMINQLQKELFESEQTSLKRQKKIDHSTKVRRDGLYNLDSLAERKLFLHWLF